MPLQSPFFSRAPHGSFFLICMNKGARRASRYKELFEYLMYMCMYIRLIAYRKKKKKAQQGGDFSLNSSILVKLIGTRKPPRWKKGRTDLSPLTLFSSSSSSSFPLMDQASRAEPSRSRSKDRTIQRGKAAL